MSEEMISTCWYAVHTRSNQEKIANEALLNRGMESFLPTYETLSRWKDRRMLLTRPLFPGYLFVRMPANDKLRVKVVPGVVDVLCDRGRWDAVDERFVQCLQQKEASQVVEPHQYPPIGREVMILSGPFSGLQGVLVQHLRGKNRVVISVTAIVSAFSIEIDRSEVREVGSRSTSLPAQAGIDSWTG